MVSVKRTLHGEEGNRPTSRSGGQVIKVSLNFIFHACELEITYFPYNHLL